MTEDDWLNEDDLECLLDYLEEKASRRKLRLFAVGCVRSIQHLLPDQNCRAAVEVAEAYADGRATGDAMNAVHDASEWAANVAWQYAAHVVRDGKIYVASKQHALARDFPGVAQVITKAEFDEVDAGDTIDAIAAVLAHSAIPPDQWGTAAGDDAAQRAVESERPRQVRLFRDVFGDPFRPVSIKGAWLTWNGGTIPRLAQAIYDDRAFDRLPVLADALEEAGCTNGEILGHLRGPGPHTRGCWPLDLLLGNE